MDADGGDGQRAVSGTGGDANGALARYAWVVFGYTVPVILFGAFVSSSLSGDGCGVSWPNCHGALLPDGSLKSAIEYTHRVSSGLLGPMVLALVAWAFRAFPRGHASRRWSVVALLFTLIEGVIGMLLVKNQWVVHDSSVERVAMSGVHLANTFVLLAALALCAHYAAGHRPARWRGQGSVAWALGFGLFGLMALAATGTIASLGDLIFPSKTLAEGLSKDLDPTSHFLLRLRALHPLIATSIGVYLVWMAGLVAHLRPSPETRKWARALVVLFAVQMVVGIVNLLFGAPIPLQTVHLLLSDLNWVSLVMLSAFALAVEPARSLAEPVAEPAAPAPGGAWAHVRDYAALTKPRVVSLLLFTTVAAMFVAQRGAPDLGLTLWVCLGGYLMAGAANALNMAVERDLDEAMARTSRRPTVTERVTPKRAGIFAAVAAVSAFAVLTLAANVLTAVLALCGLLFYVLVYTLLLKRRTWQNIVIGGAAGAFPPLVGYAAVSGQLTPLAWWLFAVIFAWTPVHFWALALLIKDDYARAGVPMLPVVRGERATVIQIALYSLLTSLVSAAPLMQGEVGPVYLYGAAGLNLVLVLQSLRLWQRTDRPRALALFKYSMAYIALFFVFVAVDQVGRPL
jgi:heme o synthase